MFDRILMKVLMANFILLDKPHSFNNKSCTNRLELINIRINQIFCEMGQTCIINPKICSNNSKLGLRWKKSTENNTKKKLLDSTSEFYTERNKSLILLETTKDSIQINTHYIVA